MVLVGSNTLELITSGHELLGQLVAAVDAAQERVYLETFIWRCDPSGDRLEAALRRAASRGVDVRLVWDPLLSSHELPLRLERSGVCLLRYGVQARRPADVWPFARDHRKLAVVDGVRAWAGGFNVGEPYMSWRDAHVRIDGPTALEVERAFVDLWNRYHPEPAVLRSAPDRFNPHLRIHVNDPGRSIFPIRGIYAAAIARAEERVQLTSAYFVPDRHLVGALIEAAERGVDVRVVVPRRSNHPIVAAIGQAWWRRLIRGGVAIHRFEQGMLHAKMLTIDGEWSTVGTANVDRISLLGNHEIAVQVHSAEFAAVLEREFAHQLRHSTLAQEPPARFAHAVMRRLSPLV